MRHLAKTIRIVLAMLLLSPLVAALPAARAQDAETLAKLERLHKRLAKPDKVISVEQGRDVFEKLFEMDVSPATVKPRHRLLVIEIEILAALAVGDAARAQEMLPDLETAPDIAGALRLTALVATVAGDAGAGYDALTKLRKLVDEEGRKRISARRHRFMRVGLPVPEQPLKTAGSETISLARRDGKALLLDFWKSRQKRTEAEHAALAAVHKQYGGDQEFELLGINSDPRGRLRQAQTYAREHHYVWKQHYEQRSSGAPLTHKAFKLGSKSVQMIIDRDGVIRAVGLITEPAFQYALRATVAEANGEYPSLMPRTRDGRKSDAARVARERRRQAEEAKNPPPKMLPSDPIAASLLRQARLYLKTGKRTLAREIFERVVREYPGTPEAKDAEFWLERP